MTYQTPATPQTQHSQAYIKSLQLQNALVTHAGQPSPLLLMFGQLIGAPLSVKCKHQMLEITFSLWNNQEQIIYVPLDSPLAQEMLEKYEVR